ncbi:hypothetical protein LX32DRAFT_657882 [Colletotrichum zoysiae]|uniref:Uncharacterized protein n=1 Tax=Colletotrichum zoysiae TaxID=1216348 RepID=A0AAD9H4Z5_9PEZI|nr:hypothetical protein LX32DRAFT_657882 [Colletotrichum zoysiae]
MPTWESAKDRVRVTSARNKGSKLEAKAKQAARSLAMMVCAPSRASTRRMVGCGDARTHPRVHGVRHRSGRQFSGTACAVDQKRKLLIQGFLEGYWLATMPDADNRGRNMSQFTSVDEAEQGQDERAPAKPGNWMEDGLHGMVAPSIVVAQSSSLVARRWGTRISDRAR